MWSLLEQRAIHGIQSELSMFSLPVVNRNELSDCLISLRDADRLSHELTDRGAYIPRRVFEHLGCDESLPFRFRMDHKLVQALLLNEYLPDLIPVTTGLAQICIQAQSCSLSEYLGKRFPLGFVVKRALGAASKRAQVLQSGPETLDAPLQERVLAAYDGSPTSETYVVQERITSTHEYRVHTIGRSVIPSLTFRTFAEVYSAFSQEEQLSVENIVEKALLRLPDGLCSDLVCGWDVALTAQGQFKVFELNYAGLHPVYEAGFQCSGYFHSSEDGSLNTARLITFIAATRHVNVVFDFGAAESSVELELQAQMYRISGWVQLLRVVGLLERLWLDSCRSTPTGLLSLRQLIYDNKSRAEDRLYVGYLDVLRKLLVELQVKAG